MLRSNVRLVVVGGMALALAVPAAAAAQGQGRVRVQAPPVQARGAGAASGRPTSKEVPVRATRRTDSRAGGRDERGSADLRIYDDRGSSAGRGRDDRRREGARADDGRYDDRRYDDRRYDDAWDDRRWDGARGEVGRWQVRSEADLRLFGFLGVDLRWDRYDRRDRDRWVERYRSYDGWGGFAWHIEGWYVPRWEAIRFDRDPLRYGPRPLDHRDLRSILGSRTFNRIVRETPGGAGQMWGRVERFGPRGRSFTLEIWSRDRFLIALTDFDRDRWVDDVVVNRRYWR